MDNNLKSRGAENSPILIIGHSLPKNSDTIKNIKEVLDRRHLVYNSIIIPLKYYINQYLYNDKGYLLRNDYMNREDIFLYINAFDEELSGKKLDEKLLKEYINKQSVKIVLCMGIDVFKAILKMYKHNLGLGVRYRYDFTHKILGKKNFDNDTEFLGESFDFLSNNEGKIVPNKYILPILHNSSNTNFQNTAKFVPVEERYKYNYDINDSEFIIYFEYMAHVIGDLLLSDVEIKKNYINDVREFNLEKYR